MALTPSEAWIEAQLESAPSLTPEQERRYVFLLTTRPLGTLRKNLDPAEDDTVTHKRLSA